MRYLRPSTLKHNNSKGGLILYFLPCLHLKQSKYNKNNNRTTETIFSHVFLLWTCMREQVCLWLQVEGGGVRSRARTSPECIRSGAPCTWWCRATRATSASSTPTRPGWAWRWPTLWSSPWAPPSAPWPQRTSSRRIKRWAASHLHKERLEQHTHTHARTHAHTHYLWLMRSHLMKWHHMLPDSYFRCKHRHLHLMLLCTL